MITSGSIIKRKNKNGHVWQITIELPKDPVTGKRVRKYKTVSGTKKEAERAILCSVCVIHIYDCSLKTKEVHACRLRI